jgi:hypothetical protein
MILLDSREAYQLPVVEMALAGARMLRGVISAANGQHVIQDFAMDITCLGTATSCPTSLQRRNC